MIDHFPIEKVRSETVECQSQLFFNSAGSSLVSDEVLDVQIQYLKEEAKIGGYDLMMKREQDFHQFYIETSNLLKVEPRNVAFTTSATDSYAKVISSFNWNAESIIVTTKDDYVSNILTFLNLKSRYGVRLEFVQQLENGDLDYDDLRQKLKNLKPILFAMTHIPTSSGTIHDAVLAGQICEDCETTYLLDACQSVGQIDVNVKEIKCDFLTATGRKFLRGPRGTGLLYVSDKILAAKSTPESIDLAGNEWNEEMSFKRGDTAKRFELWERNYASLLGLTQSIREINSIGINLIEAYNYTLSKKFRAILQSIDDVMMYDHGSKKGSIITWRHIHKDLSSHQEILANNKINYSLASNRSALIDLNKKGEEWLIRFSPHYFNTLDEGEEMGEILTKWAVDS